VLLLQSLGVGGASDSKSLGVGGASDCKSHPGFCKLEGGLEDMEIVLNP